MRRVVVTGAEGHVGNNLCRRLIANGDRVCAIVFDESTASLEGLPVEKVKGDVTDPATLAAPFAGADVVVHLAAIISTIGDPDGRLQRVNVEGARNVARACLEHGVGRLIHMSSIHAFNHVPSLEPLDESREPPAADAPAYDRSKAAGEREVLRAVDDGLDAVILNPTGILGPNDFTPSIMGRTLAEYAGRSFPALGNAGFDWVDVRDVVDAILAAMERGRKGERYILSGGFHEMRDLSRIVQAASGGGERIFVIPTWLMRTIIPPIHLWSRIRGTHPAFTAEALDALLTGNRRVSHAKAARELGFSPRPLSETVSDAIACFRRRGVVQPRGPHRLARNAWVRWAFINLNLLLSRLSVIHPWLPPRLRDRLFVGWTHEMRRMAFRSMGQRLYLDVPCELPTPAELRSLTEAPSFRLCTSQLEEFYRKGWAGPFDLLAESEMPAFRMMAEEIRTSRPSSVYRLGEGHTAADRGPLDPDAVRECVNTRDRHLDCPELWDLFARPEIVERLAQLLGPDVLVWRSQFFNKDPGKPATHWHAASCYVADSLTMPALIPRDLNELFQITVWIALDDVDRENGCLLLIPGSQRTFHPMRVADLDEPRQAWWHGPGAQSDHPYAYPHPIPESAFNEGHVEAVPMKAGQFLLFSERCIHGAGPNSTEDRRRLGINFRAIRGDVSVNKDMNGADLLYNDFLAARTRFDLKNWGVGELRGRTTAPNRIALRPTAASGREDPAHE